MTNYRKSYRNIKEAASKLNESSDGDNTNRFVERSEANTIRIMKYFIIHAKLSEKQQGA